MIIFNLFNGLRNTDLNHTSFISFGNPKKKAFWGVWIINRYVILKMIKIKDKRNTIPIFSFTLFLLFFSSYKQTNNHSRINHIEFKSCK